MSTVQLEGQESSSPSAMATGVDGKLSKILDFLLLKTESREQCREVPQFPMENSKAKFPMENSKAKLKFLENHERRQPPRKPSAAVLRTHPERVMRRFFCESGEHETKACTVPETEACTAARRCFRCTVGGTSQGSVKKKVNCIHCNKSHASSVCNPDWKATEVKEVLATNVQAASKEEKVKEVALQTFRTLALGESNWGYLRGVTGSGSRRTFIQEDIFRTLNLRTLGTTHFHLNTFGSQSLMPKVAVWLNYVFGVAALEKKRL